jgi:putative FmdB family regulatory protein
VPIYDYVCASCKNRIEVIHRIDAEGPRFCPACGAEGTMRKAVGTPAVHFKGSGWAKKDRSSASRARARSGGDSSSGSDSSAAGHDDSKGESSGGDAASTAKTTGEPASPGDAKPASGAAGSAGSTSSRADSNKAPGKSTRSGND